MDIHTLQKEMDDLSRTFNTQVSASYSTPNKDWSVQTGVYICGFSRNTMSKPDGSKENLLGAWELAARDPSLEEAIRRVKNATIDSGRSYLLANQSFGLFCGNDDDGPLIITPYVDNKPQESFEYNETKIRGLLADYGVKAPS